MDERQDPGLGVNRSLTLEAPNFPVPLYRTSISGVIEFANTALVDLLGFPDLRTLREVPLESLYQDPAERKAWLAELFETGVVSDRVVGLKHYSGRHIWVQDVGRAVVGSDGEIVGAEGALIDITASWKAAQALQHALKLSTSMFDRTPHALLVEDFSEVLEWVEELEAAGITDVGAYLDANPSEVHFAASLIKVVAANAAAADLLDAQSPEDLMGSLAVDQLTTSSRKILRDQIVAVTEGQTDFEASFIGRTLRGDPIHLYLFWIAGRLEGFDDYSRVLIALIDRTKTIELEERLRRHIHSRDAFLESVAHRIRTPLTGVIGFSELLEEEWEKLDEVDRREQIGLLRSEAKRLNRVFQEILIASRGYSWGATTGLSLLDLAAIAAEVVNEVDPASRARITLAVKETWAHANPTMVGQIVYELLSNAIEHGGPAITVETRSGENWAELVVKDNGPGPDAEERLLFEKYAAIPTDPGQAPYMGVGLANARLFARQMGGDVLYRKVPDGVEFSLYLITAHHNG